MIWTLDEPYLAVGGGLLEGPSYDERRNVLRWVDIDKDYIYLHDLSDEKAVEKFAIAGNTIGTIANIDGSENLILVAAKRGFATFDITSGRLSHIRGYFDGEVDAVTDKRFRANDGAIDARGRLLQGVLIDDKYEQPGPEGMLISLHPTGRMDRLVENVVCPNGLGWNTANDVMFWAESFSGNVYAFDYDLDTGSASNKRIFFHLPLGPEENTNRPDGLAIDVEDHIWLAIWGDSRVVRLSPAGEIVDQILLPTRFVTCPVFVGTDIYITTAAERDPERYPESARYGGHIYKCSVGIRGLPRYQSQEVHHYN